MLEAILRPFKSWNAFWFTPADPTVLGLIRLFAGFLILYVHVAYTYDLQELFGEHAWVDAQIMDEFRLKAPIVRTATNWEIATTLKSPTPEQMDFVKRWGADPNLTYAEGRWMASIWFHVTNPGWMSFVHYLGLGVMFLFAIGFCTRITSVLTWLYVISYIQRAHTTLFGMDTIMNIVMIYLMIGPSGAAFSVDRLLSRYWKTRRALANHEPPPNLWRPEPMISANLAIRLMQVHLCFVYVASGLSKLQGSSWWTGMAVWGTMANYEFSPLDIGIYEQFLQWVCQHRWMWELMVTGGTVFTLVFEISFPFLVFNPRFRWVMIVAAVLLHTGITIFMGLTMFSLFMMALLLSFVPVGAVYRLIHALGRNARQLAVCFDPRDQRQLRTASLLRACDIWEQVDLGVSETASQLELRIGRETYRGTDATSRAVRSLRLFQPWAWISWPAKAKNGANANGRNSSLSEETVSSAN